MVRRARLNPFGLDWERFTVAVDGQDGVIGCVQLKRHAGGAVELASLVVRRDWRGRGVGRALIAAMKAESHGGLWLMCRPNLVSYYEKVGFQVVERSSCMGPYFRWIWYFSRTAILLGLGRFSPAIMHWPE